jgi:hypothetical protein
LFYRKLKADQFQAFEQGLSAIIETHGQDNVFVGDNLITIDRHVGFTADRDFMNAFRAESKTVATQALIWRLHTLCWAALHAINIEGDFVECGVYEGFSSAVVARRLNFAALDKRMWLYDLFDHEQETSGMVMPAHGPGLHRRVVRRFSEFPNIRIIKGFVPRSFEIGAPERRRAGVSDIVLGNWASAVGGPGLESGTFAAVTAFDVLEHLPRLEEDVALVRSLLVPGGLFFASVPDIASLVARAMGKRWNMLLLEHLWYFSPATFDRFMARFGFERVAMQALPFDAPLAHVVTRLAQTFGMRGNLVPRGLARMVLPAPAGIMLGTYRAV